jgi:hypothetical protein
MALHHTAYWRRKVTRRDECARPQVRARNRRRGGGREGHALVEDLWLPADTPLLPIHDNRQNTIYLCNFDVCQLEAAVRPGLSITIVLVSTAVNAYCPNNPKCPGGMPCIITDPDHPETNYCERGFDVVPVDGQLYIQIKPEALEHLKQ